jgi:hypothetical protein
LSSNYSEWPIITKITSLQIMGNDIRMQLRRPEYAERFPKRHHPGPRQFINLVERRNRQDWTQNYRKL